MHYAPLLSVIHIVQFTTSGSEVSRNLSYWSATGVMASKSPKPLPSLVVSIVDLLVLTGEEMF